MEIPEHLRPPGRSSHATAANIGLIQLPDRHDGTDFTEDDETAVVDGVFDQVRQLRTEQRDHLALRVLRAE